MPESVNPGDAREFEEKLGLNATALRFWGNSNRNTCTMDQPPTAAEIASAWQLWSDIFALPQLQDTSRAPAPRRRRRNAIRARRPKFLVRRRAGGLLNPANIYRGEHEIIARD